MKKEARDPNNPPVGLVGRARRRWISNARKESRNKTYQETYPEFEIPESYYRTFHIHEFTSDGTMDLIIQHVEQCSSFSIDTESDQYSLDLALIQVQSIPDELPAFILLISIKNLIVHSDSRLKKVSKLFSLLFNSGKTLLCWGDCLKELKPIKNLYFISWPIQAKTIDVQKEFGHWIEKKQLFKTSCDSLVVNCGNGNLWSLQDAILITSERFLDKSGTRQSWSKMIDPLFSTLPLSKLQAMIKYSIYDCLALTYLHRAVLEDWCLEKFQDTPMNLLFIMGKVDDLINNETFADSYDASMNVKVNVRQSRSQYGKSIRSQEARTRRNKKRNSATKKFRFVHTIVRSFYHGFTIRQMKDILRDRGIKKVNLKTDSRSNLIFIGTNNPDIIDKYFDLIPDDLFDKKNYRYMERS